MWTSVTRPTHYMTLLFRCERVWQGPPTTWLCCLDVNECDKAHHYMTLLLSRCEWVWQGPPTTWLCPALHQQGARVCQCPAGLRVWLWPWLQTCNRWQELHRSVFPKVNLYNTYGSYSKWYVNHNNDYLLSWRILFLGKYSLNIPFCLSPVSLKINMY